MDLALRKTYRSQVTKLTNLTNELLVSENKSASEINILIERLKSMKLNLNAVNEKLTPTFNEDQFENECAKIVEYDEAITIAIAKLKQCLEKISAIECSVAKTVVQTPVTAVTETTSILNNSTSTQSGPKMQVKLPKLELIKFNGDVLKWPAFWEQFNESIHGNKEISDNAKFSYLKSLLTDRAAITIAGLTTSKNSYNDAIKLLKEEYANTDVIVDAYIQKLLSVTCVRHERDIFSLRKLYNTASTITHSLSTLGVNANQYGLMVKSIIFKALPYNLKIQYNKTKMKRNVYNQSSDDYLIDVSDNDNQLDYTTQITDLLNFIKLEIDSIEQATEVENKNKITSNSTKTASTFKRNNQCTAAGLFSAVNEACLFCKSSHHLTKNCNNSAINIEKKKQILKDNSRCFRCTKANHNSKVCRSSDRCGKCNGRHVQVMCDPNYTKNNRERNANGNKTNVTAKATVDSKNGAQSSTESSTNLFSNGSIDNALLQTACALIRSKSNNSDAYIRVVIDGGSQLTFIKESISRQLKLPIIGTHKLTILSFGSAYKPPAKLCNRVKVDLKSQFDDRIIEICAIEVPEICFDALKPPSLKNKLICEFSSNHQLADDNLRLQKINGIGLLIGADNYWKIVTGEIKRLSENLMAINTCLGWTLHGSPQKIESNNEIISLSSLTVLNTQVDFDDEIPIKRLWDLEAIGINSIEDQNHDFTDKFIKEKIIKVNDRFEVSLPWTIENPVLESNYSGAFAHLKYLTTKLCKTNKLLEYDRGMREYMTNDCAELVPDDCIKNENRNVYYMPHRPVYREDKDTTKLRIVFNASAHEPGSPSLNDLLSAGENLLPDLVKIILNFRLGSIAIVADIEKAFLQICLNEIDRDSHRFFWYSEPIKENLTIDELPSIKSYRMKRVTFGVTASPFLLAATLRKLFLEQTGKMGEISKKLLNCFYMDDLVTSVNTIDEAKELYQCSCEILRSCSMNLRKWCSNNKQFLNYISEDDESKIQLKKILGIFWHVMSDDLFVDLNFVLNDDCHNLPTKRNVLKTMAKVFDPLGILGPFIVRIKLFIQKLWKENYEWDTPLTSELANEWKQWCSELPFLHDYSIPRKITDATNAEVNLHVFADASPNAYGAVAYLQDPFTRKCSFVMSKNRVAPLNQKGDKILTLPKLELTAAVCAARLQSYIIQNTQLQFKEIIMWSDSKIALCWIKNKSNKLNPYVKNRVREIENLSKGSWKYCPGTDNPADMLTRGVSAKLLLKSNSWLTGPLWLQESKENWPIENNGVENEIMNCFVQTNDLKNEEINSIFELNKFENLDKMYRVTAYVLRFINNIRSKNENNSGFLKSHELKKAELYWIKFIQMKEFKEEVLSLRKNKTLNKNSSLLTLTPFLDEQMVIRLGGRLSESFLPFETKHPIILPKKSHLTDKIIWKNHKITQHSGVNSTLAEVRKRFWVIQGRQRIKNVISKCIVCKKMKGKSGNEPFAPLPKDRMAIGNAFKIIGIDFAGPLFVASQNGQLKVYIMLITCAVVRAVHLELVPDLTTESCIRAFRRFISRRGVPIVVYSDNAKTFKRASLEITELFKILETEEMQKLSQNHRIEWRFIVERASWWGGFWERLVRTVKSGLKFSLGKKCVGHDELQTILTEVEAIVNSRPLTYIDDDPSNLLVLTPQKFLIGDSLTSMNFDPSAKRIGRSEIVNQWKVRESLINKFWRRWASDYLQQLRSAHMTPSSDSSSFKVGDIVLLHDQKVPRLLWKLARIANVFPGRDGRIRSCEVQVGDGRSFRRPIQLLYPLEL